MSRFRAEVTEYKDGMQRAWVVYCDPDVLSEEEKAKARPVIEAAVQQLARVAGQTETWARELLFAMAVERLADMEAYEREAARRGVLAL